MKAKLKGQSGIKGLALLHGEKVLIGVVALLAMYFVYSSFSVSGMSREFQATNLAEKITATNRKIEETRWPDRNSPEAEQVRFSRPIEQNAELKVPLSLTASNPANLNPPVIKPTVLRIDPPLLNAEDLKAIGGSGLFAFKDKEKYDQFQIEERRKQEQLELKQKQDAERNADMQGEQQRGTRRPGRDGRGGPEGVGTDPDYDPARPNRRRIQGQVVAAGVQITGGERIEQRFWATVVAKVPVRKQQELYAEAFENAKGGYDPTRDMPNYIGYMVERAEVLPGEPLTWKSVPVYDGQQNSKRYKGMTDEIMARIREAAQMFWAPSGSVSEPVDMRYLDPILTFPAPPLVGRNFGADATHPDIPLAANAPPEMPEEMMPETALPDEQESDEGELQFGTGVPGQIPMSGGPITSEFNLRGMGPEGGMGMPSYGVEGQGAMLARGVDYKLFRFVDFTVQPGKRYKYRVKLILRDPNFGVDKSFLAAEVLDREMKLHRTVTEWSAPSPTVGIPLAGSVRLAQVKPKTDKPNDEPVASLLVEAFDVDEQGVPIQAAAEMKDFFRRGAVANLTGDAEFVEANGQFVDKKSGFHFRTGMTVLDITGGEKLPFTRDMVAPARILLMGPAGELYIRNETDDKPAVDYHRQLFDEEAAKQFEGGMEFGSEGGGRRPPGGGRGRTRGPQ